MNDGLLRRGNYLRGEPGAWRIELEPEGERPFLEWVNVILGHQGPLLERERRQREPEPPEWADRFRIADPLDPPLSREETWREVGRLMQTQLAKGWQPPEQPLHLETLVMMGVECLSLVEEGARWCPDRWHRYEAEVHLEFAHDEDSRAALREMLAAGTVPADLVPAVEQALA